MEILKQVRVVTSEKKCIFKERSAFHMNLPGFALPVNEKELFVKVDNFWMPKKKKNVKFSMFFNREEKYSDSSQLKSFDVNYYSMEDLVNQINCLVWNNFIGKEHNCCKTVDDGLISGEDPEKARRPYYSHVDCSKRFVLKYENNCFLLNMYKGYIFVVSPNIAKLLNFESQQNWDPDPMKISAKYTIGKPCHFLADHERICHVVIKNLVDSSFCGNGGGSYGVICSYDVENMQMTPFLKRLSCRFVRDLQFYLIDDNNESYFEGDELGSNAVRFTLNFLKTL